MPTTQAHILVVDDNEEILSTISIILTRKLYKVTAMRRVEDFAEAVKKLAPDLILLDKNLGWADGCELCKTIKQHSLLAPIPVIMFSAYYKKREECLDAGANEFIEKPFEMLALLQTIERFTENRNQLEPKTI